MCREDNNHAERHYSSIKEKASEIYIKKGCITEIDILRLTIDHSIETAEARKFAEEAINDIKNKQERR